MQLRRGMSFKRASDLSFLVPDTEFWDWPRRLSGGNLLRLPGLACFAYETGVVPRPHAIRQKVKSKVVQAHLFVIIGILSLQETKILYGLLTM